MNNGERRYEKATVYDITTHQSALHAQVNYKLAVPVKFEFDRGWYSWKNDMIWYDGLY